MVRALRLDLVSSEGKKPTLGRGGNKREKKRGTSQRKRRGPRTHGAGKFQGKGGRPKY